MSSVPVHKDYKLVLKWALNLLIEKICVLIFFKWQKRFTRL